MSDHRVATAPTASPNESEREQQDLLDALRRATIGEYDVYSPIGQGGMATVFLALELALNRPVAIKVISPSALGSTTVIDRFWLEARTAASLSHPHVIPIFGVRSLGGLHFLIMKHIQGGSLDVVLKNEGPFSFSLVRTILDQVAGALAYAHRRGVVHRDIKPANIMLDDEGYAIVMDFGIAKVRDVAALTASGAMVGTPYYMSPEQFNGQPVDGRSDQYSLGIVAFELITGRRPFRGDSVPEVLRGHLLDKPPDVRELRADCPTSLATMINRMLCKSPEDRFPSMETLCVQLGTMPRINADKMREKIVSLARTASISSPQISEPMSPVPLSRSTSGQGRDAPTPAATPFRTKDAIKAFRRHPWIAAAALGGIAVATAAAMQWTRANESDISAASQPLPQPESRITPDSQAARAPVIPPAALPAFDSPSRDLLAAMEPQSPMPKAKESPEKKRGPSAASREPASKKADGERDSRVAAESKSAQDLSALGFLQADTTPPLPIVMPKPPTAFRVGTRIRQAVFYIDGQVVGMRTGRTTFVHPPGRVQLRIAAEDCVAFDTLFTLIEGDTAELGWRNPKCTK